jgi:hypothetical protein
MTNIDTRIQDFYYKGKQDGVDEMIDFLLKLSKQVDQRPLPLDVNAGQFIATLATAMGEHFGYAVDGEAVR